MKANIEELQAGLSSADKNGEIKIRKQIEDARELITGILLKYFAIEQKNAMVEADKNDILNALKATGLNNDRISATIDKIILFELPENIGLEGRRSRIGAVISETRDNGFNILFPKERIRDIVNKQNINIY